jgi:hypothetical protein
MMGSGCRFQPIANVAVRPIPFAVGMRIVDVSEERRLNNVPRPPRP